MIHSTHDLAGARATLHRADAVAFLQGLKPRSVALTFTSPPYCIGKEYDNAHTLDAFIAEFDRSLEAMVAATEEGGSICWQVGHNVWDGSITPLDAIIIERLRSRSDLRLKNRIVWSFAHGAHAKTRFSGRHETLLWYSKGEAQHFDLDSVRVPQKYPGKRHYKGPRKGQPSGNPLGKNPGDVWDIPNVKSRHPEKTAHPCQFPVALARRMIRALSHPGALVIDPYMGSATTGIASLLEGRNFAGCDLENSYIQLAASRFGELVGGKLQIRPDIPPREPSPRDAVSQKPAHFKW